MATLKVKVLKTVNQQEGNLLGGICLYYHHEKKAD